MVTEPVLCNRALGTQKESTRFGTCNKKATHTGSCSSELLKKYRREAVAKTRLKQKQAPTVIDDSILDNPKDAPEDDVAEGCACGHTLNTCPNPKTCGLSKSQLEERRKAELEAEARETERIQRLAQQETERQFITAALDKIAAGEIPDHQTETKLTQVIASYLGFSGDKRFRLAPEERIARGLDCESRLSEALYGPSYTGLYQPVDKLDESSFSVRLGRFLQVGDKHGSRNIPNHPSMVKSKSPEVSLPPLGLPVP